MAGNVAKPLSSSFILISSVAFDRVVVRTVNELPDSGICPFEMNHLEIFYLCSFIFAKAFLNSLGSFATRD